MREKCLQIAIVEDDASLSEWLVRELTLDGFSAYACANAMAFWRHAALTPPDVVVLDIGLPDEDGFSIARQLRKSSSVGIIILTGYGDDTDRERGLLDGADAYLVKPVNVRVLVASIRSVARRLPVMTTPPSKPEGWCIHAQGWKLLTPSGVSVTLNAYERHLLRSLMAAEGTPVTKEQLIGDLGGSQTFDVHQLEMVIYRLRRKVAAISAPPLPLEAVRGVGYLWAI